MLSKYVYMVDFQKKIEILSIETFNPARRYVLFNCMCFIIWDEKIKTSALQRNKKCPCMIIFVKHMAAYGLKWEKYLIA